MEFNVVEVRWSESVATKCTIEQMVLQILMGFASFHHNLKTSYEQRRRADNRIDDHSPSIVRHVLNKLYVHVPMLRRICLAVYLIGTADRFAREESQEFANFHRKSASGELSITPLHADPTWENSTFYRKILRSSKITRDSASKNLILPIPSNVRYLEQSCSHSN